MIITFNVSSELGEQLIKTAVKHKGFTSIERQSQDAIVAESVESPYTTLYGKTRSVTKKPLGLAAISDPLSPQCGIKSCGKYFATKRALAIHRGWMHRRKAK